MRKNALFFTVKNTIMATNNNERKNTGIKRPENKNAID